MAGPDFTANSGGLLSPDANLKPGTISLGGTVTAGNVVTATIIVGGTPYQFQIIAQSGDTLQTLVNAFIAAINANTSLAALGITANQGNPALMAFSFLWLRNGTPLPTISASATGTITTEILSQPVDQLDAGPVDYTNRAAANKSGDNCGYRPFNGKDSNGNWATYALLEGEVGNPDIAAIQGRLHLSTGGVNPQGGNIKRRATLERGIILYDAQSAPATGGDKGQGTINVPSGYFVNGVNVRQRDCFVATMSGNQTSIQDNVMTTIAFDTVGVNVGVQYDTANKRWMPPPGMVRLGASLLMLPNDAYLYIAKNGSPFRGSGRGNVTALDYANGTDYYQAFVLFTGSGAPHTLDGQALYSWFEGEQL